MTYLCVRNEAWRGDTPVARSHTALLSIVPRISIQGELLWVDLRDLPLRETAERVMRVLRSYDGTPCTAGVAETPIAAEVAGRCTDSDITYVPTGEERAFLAPFPVAVLHPDPVTANLLDGAGVETCAELARLAHDAVAVRFGADGVRVWRLARADDPRQLFAPIPRALPEAAMEWSEYTVRRAERLLFVINALCGNVCRALQERGDGAVEMTLRFSLANRTTYEHPLRVARPTARQVAWMRLLRLALEQIVLPDAVVGIALRVERTAGVGGVQGDLFDRGFGTVAAAEESVEALLDQHGTIVVEPESTQHPLIDRRTVWTAIPAMRAVEARVVRESAPPVSDATTSDTAAPALTLQLLPVPRRVTVATVARRGSEVPRSYRDPDGTHAIVDVAGPDRVSGGEWDRAYAREYFRCVTGDGVLVWLYRDVRANVWYLHGWWD